MTKRTWGVVALLASLAVNIALIGFVLGATLRSTLAPRAFQSNHRHRRVAATSAP